MQTTCSPNVIISTVTDGSIPNVTRFADAPDLKAEMYFTNVFASNIPNCTVLKYELVKYPAGLQLAPNNTNITFGVLTRDIKTLRIYNFTVIAKAEGGSVSSASFNGSLEVYSQCEDDNITLSTRPVAYTEQLSQYYRTDA